MLAARDDYSRCYTVWQFTSTISGETVIKVRVSEPDDQRYDFPHQRILWRGIAATPRAALERTTEKG
jgi:hypothetical protein